jgi:hypothetical protein
VHAEDFPEPSEQCNGAKTWLNIGELSDKNGRYAWKGSGGDDSVLTAAVRSGHLLSVASLALASSRHGCDPRYIEVSILIGNWAKRY